MDLQMAFCAFCLQLHFWQVSRGAWRDDGVSLKSLAGRAKNLLESCTKQQLDAYCLQERSRTIEHLTSFNVILATSTPHRFSFPDFFHHFPGLQLPRSEATSPRSPLAACSTASIGTDLSLERNACEARRESAVLMVLKLVKQRKKYRMGAQHQSDNWKVVSHR